MTSLDQRTSESEIGKLQVGTRYGWCHAREPGDCGGPSYVRYLFSVVGHDLAFCETHTRPFLNPDLGVAERIG